MAKIKYIEARQIFDSRGNPTVEALVTLDNGNFARAAIPSGASDGIHEALKQGVNKVVDLIDTIIRPGLIEKDPTEQAEIDRFMVLQLDGTFNEKGLWCKEKLGGIAILAVSLAVCKAGAAVKEIPLYKHIANLADNGNLVLPVPVFSVINGGAHAGNGVPTQEFMILPVRATSFKEAMKMGVAVRHHLKAVTKKKNIQDAAKVGDIGEIIQGKEEVQELLKTAIEKAGYVGKFFIGTDASEFYGEDKTCDLNFKEENNDGSQKIFGDALKNLYQSVGNEYSIVSIEDPFDQDDQGHCSKMTCELGEHVQIVGDDLLVANPKRVEKAINEKSCNALLLKVNDKETVTEIIEAVKLLKMAGRKVMASFWGSKEPIGMFNALLGKLFPCFGKCQGFGSEVTEDTFIADLAVGLATGQIKTGTPCRSGRLTKYNRLLQIEEELSAEAVYAGANFCKPVEPY